MMFKQNSVQIVSNSYVFRYLSWYSTEYNVMHKTSTVLLDSGFFFVRKKKCVCVGGGGGQQKVDGWVRGRWVSELEGGGMSA